MQLFHLIGLWIGRWPVHVLVVTALVSLPLLSRFLLYPINVVTDIRRGFAHVGGRSAQELQVFAEFYNVTNIENLEIVILTIESKDRGVSRMPMNSQLLDEVMRVDGLFKRASVPSLANSSRRISIAELESPMGELNFAFHGFMACQLQAMGLFVGTWALSEQEERLAANRSLDTAIKLDFPTAEIWGHRAPLYMNFFNPRLYDGNRRDQLHPSSIESVESVALWYWLEVDGVHVNRAMLQEMELQLFDAVRDANFSSLLSVLMYGDELANYEMMRGSGQCARMLTVGMLLMLAFMSLALRRFGWRAQLILVPAAIFSPLLAIATTFAVMGWLGVDINSVMSVMPFLVLGIGVDDAFLLLHSWRKWSSKVEIYDPAKRIASVMAEIGPSITITSLTNVLAFGIGVLAPSWIMSTFCLATAIAIGIDFLFQLVVFTPCMVLSGRLTARAATTTDVGSTADESYWQHYARFVGSRWGRGACVALLITLYGLAFLGVSRMEARFEPSKSLPLDSALLESSRVLDRIYTEYTPITFIVEHPPNISDESDLGRFFDFVAKLEAHPRSYSPKERTQLWLRDYLDYERLHRHRALSGAGTAGANDTSPNYQLVPGFLSDHLLDDKHVVVYHVESGEEVIIDSFVFLLAYKGPVDWHARATFISELREIVDAYGEFRVAVFHYDATIFDMIVSVKPELTKAVLITLASMAVVCFLIIPHAKYTSLAIFNVLSICFTLLGALGWWSLDYDPVTMITMLMAIGYSVDYSAHVCYHYYKAQQRSATLRDRGEATDADRTVRMREILHAVGRPMLEAAASTLICMIPLFFVPIYIVSAFAKTCVSVVLLGLAHGMFVLPVALLLLDAPTSSSTKRRQSGGNTKRLGEGNGLIVGKP